MTDAPEQVFNHVTQKGSYAKHKTTWKPLGSGIVLERRRFGNEAEVRRGVPSAVFQKFEEEEVWNESYNYVNY